MEQSKLLLRRGSKKEDGHKAHEATGMMRWLLTYADMLTLLFALFVILYAMSRPQIQSIIETQKSLAKAFHGKPASLTQVYQQMQQNPRISSSEKVREVKQFLQYLKSHAKERSVKRFLKQNPTLSKQIHPSVSPMSNPYRPLKMIQKELRVFRAQNRLEGDFKTTIQPKRGLVIQLLTDGVLFSLGRAYLKPKAKEIVAKIAQFIQQQHVQGHIRIDGFTDNTPILGGPYKNNLMLSMARAANVWVYMVKMGISPERISAAGYGKYRPLVPNTTPANRRLNRRVEITIPPFVKVLKKGNPFLPRKF
ncbi:MAG: flagellar motor protein MotB [Firmicutes bacterium]|nr:flagellar motor protein MotB [Bacillota bacterium]